jgi:hypothetical protein
MLNFIYSLLNNFLAFYQEAKFLRLLSQLLQQPAESRIDPDRIKVRVPFEQPQTWKSLSRCVFQSLQRVVPLSHERIGHSNVVGRIKD